LARLEVMIAKLEVRVIQGEIDRTQTGGPPAPAQNKNLN
jgi:hypothetical protein